MSQLHSPTLTGIASGRLISPMIAESDFLCSIEMNTVNPFYAIQSKSPRSPTLAIGKLSRWSFDANPVGSRSGKRSPCDQSGQQLELHSLLLDYILAALLRNKSLFRPSDDRLLSHDRHCTSNLQHQRNPRLDCDEPHKHHGRPERRPRGYNLILGQSSRY